MIRSIALRYGFTFAQIADMTLDQIAIACEDDGEGGETSHPKKWATPIGSLDDLNRLWEERQIRRAIENG